MKDYQASLEKLRADTAEYRLICDLATDQKKRELFDRLAKHLTSLADQGEHAMIEAAKQAGTKSP
jgi:predicted kinase